MLAALCLAFLIGAAELLTILFAARDADAARRFRGLPSTVTGQVADRKRNARWHHLGAAQRGVVALLLAVATVAVAGLSWWHVGPAAAVAGGWAWRRFDYAFARRFGLPAAHLGATALIDQLNLGNLTLRRVGTVIAGAGAVWWLWLAV